jgi:hypothetical protein
MHSRSLADQKAVQLSQLPGELSISTAQPCFTAEGSIARVPIPANKRKRNLGVVGQGPQESQLSFARRDQADLHDPIMGIRATLPMISKSTVYEIGLYPVWHDNGTTSETAIAELLYDDLQLRRRVRKND